MQYNYIAENMYISICAQLIARSALAKVHSLLYSIQGFQLGVELACSCRVSSMHRVEQGLIIKAPY